MKKLSFLRLAVALTLGIGATACDDDDDITGAGGALARVSVDAPASAQSGNQFDVQITAENIGIRGLQNGRVDINFPAPLAVVGVGTSAGTNATFSNGLTGGRASWDLGTLDSNSQSRLVVRTIGVLPVGQGATRVTIEATLSGQGIGAGDAVARDEMTINP